MISSTGIDARLEISSVSTSKKQIEVSRTYSLLQHCKEMALSFIFYSFDSQKNPFRNIEYLSNLTKNIHCFPETSPTPRLQQPKTHR
jgi:hypothetical protein